MNISLFTEPPAPLITKRKTDQEHEGSEVVQVVLVLGFALALGVALLAFQGPIKDSIDSAGNNLTSLFSSMTKSNTVGGNTTIDIDSPMEGPTSQTVAVSLSGKSVQNGTPSPSSPVAIQSVQSANLVQSVGNRNYLRYTADMPVANDRYNWGGGISKYNQIGQLESTGEGVKFTFGNNWNSSMSVPLAYDGCIESGEVVTLSFTYRGNITNPGSIYFLQRTSPNVSWKCAGGDLIDDGEWHNYSYTWTATDGNVRTCYQLLLFYSLNYYGPDKWIEIEDGSLKLEKGSDATPWSPAPEDLELGTLDASYYMNSIPIDLQGNELRSLPDGTHDELNIDTDGNVTLTKNVGYVNSASLEWRRYSSWDRGQYLCYCATLPGVKRVSGAATTAEFFSSVRYVTAFKIVGRANTSGEGYVSSVSEVVTSCDIWVPEGWLNNSNFDIQYPLAEPQTISLGKIDPIVLKNNETIYCVDSLSPDISVS